MPNRHTQGTFLKPRSAAIDSGKTVVRRFNGNIDKSKSSPHVKVSSKKSKSSWRWTSANTVVSCYCAPRARCCAATPRRMQPDASPARRPRSTRAPVPYGTSERQKHDMPAWLLRRREPPAQRDGGHDGGVQARAGSPALHRLPDVEETSGLGLGRALRRARRVVPSEPTPRRPKTSKCIPLCGYADSAYPPEITKGIEHIQAQVLTLI